MTPHPHLLAAAAAALVLAGACADDGTPDTEVLGATTVQTESAPDTTVSTELAPPVVIAEQRPVGSTARTVVDPTRPTVAVPGVTGGAPDRTIPTLVLYPAAGGVPGEVVADAAPAVDGPFPLVVVSHGLTGSAEELLPLLRALAAAGYVVAAPDFPETTGGSGSAAFSRYVDQPADVSAVIDAVVADPALAGVVDPERIGAGGPSLGGLTTYGLVAADCCLDERVDAAFSLAGVGDEYPGSEYAWGDTAVLLVHGDDDDVVPYTTSADIFAELNGPGYLMTLLGEDHSAGLDDGDAGHDAVQGAVVAFLDRWLLEDLRADGALAAAADVPGIATLDTR